MFKTIKTAVLSTMIALGALGAVTAAAHAQSGFRYESNDRHDGPRAGGHNGGREHGRPDYRHNRHDDRRWACTPGRALDKAQWLGLRRARVVDVDRRTIKVVGRKFGDRVRLTFARAPNCPVIRW